MSIMKIILAAVIAIFFVVHVRFNDVLHQPTSDVDCTVMTLQLSSSRYESDNVSPRRSSVVADITCTMIDQASQFLMAHQFSSAAAPIVYRGPGVLILDPLRTPLAFARTTLSSL